ncbi:MAG TPA: site-specific integrase [Chitinophagaceae bacterium]|nr:site-specific integrase [Chitinophagaceae bacterium]
MGSVKAVLREKNNREGHNPIAIRITANRKASYIYTGQYIEKKFWDEENRRVRKSHPNSSRLNNLLLTKLAEANNKLLELESTEERVSATGVKQKIKNEKINASFFNLAEQYLSSIQKSGKYTRYSADKPRIKHFKEFLNRKDIDFKDINELLLRRFQAYLKSERKVGDRTIVNNLITIRTIFNLAIRQELVEHKYYPFGKGKIVIRFPESIKIGLDKEEITKLEKLKLKSKAQQHTLNIWLFTFYLAGMRVSDALRLRWSNIQNGRLFYSMGKNKKAGSLKLPEKALDILKKYERFKENPDDLIFPELKNADFNNNTRIQKLINNADKKFNKSLKKIAGTAEIDKKITMHISRHTFGNLSGEEIPIQMLQKLYRHTSITTTINYQANFIYKDADEALEKVLK